MFPAFFKSAADTARDNLTRERKKLLKRKDMLNYIITEAQAEVDDINEVLETLNGVDEPRQYVPFLPL